MRPTVGRRLPGLVCLAWWADGTSSPSTIGGRPSYVRIEAPEIQAITVRPGDVLQQSQPPLDSGETFHLHVAGLTNS